MEGRTEGWEVKIIFSYTELEASLSHMHRLVLECQITSRVSTLVFSFFFLFQFKCRGVLSCLSVCLSVCSCVTGTCGGQRKDAGSWGTGVTDGCELSWGCWESNPASILTTESLVVS